VSSLSDCLTVSSADPKNVCVECADFTMLNSDNTCEKNSIKNCRTQTDSSICETCSDFTVKVNVNGSD